ncbi:MAG: ABC transporter permease [Eubacteriales bacterium]
MVKSFKRLLKSNILFTLGLIICTLWILAAIFAPYIAPYDPLAQDLLVKLEGPSFAHIFGTDSLGRDVFSRVLYGGRLSITAGVLAVVLSCAIGSIYGAVAGYVGGLLDDVMMRLSELIIAFPTIILAIVITSVLGTSMMNTMIALVIVGWPSYARLMRSVVITVKEQEYITAAEALGASKFRILFKEVIPNSFTSVLVMATTGFGNQILLFATLSFLGLGVSPPTPEWGMMVSDGVDYFNKFWIAGFPGLAIFTMAMGANFIGDGLRDILDPKLNKKL